MKTWTWWGRLAVVGLFVSLGCARLPSQVYRGPGEAPRERGRPPEAVPAPAPSLERQPRVGRGPAAALVEEAEALERAGQVARAAATLERALRIAPYDPVVWHRLAVLRLAEGRPADAEQLARKSILLGAEDEDLRANNWRLIARVRRATGDAAGARDAEAKASRPGAGL